MKCTPAPASLQGHQDEVLMHQIEMGGGREMHPSPASLHGHHDEVLMDLAQLGLAV